MTSTPLDLGYVVGPTPVDLQRYLNWPELDAEQTDAAQAHLARALILVRSYTRGRGFLGEWMAPSCGRSPSPQPDARGTTPPPTTASRLASSHPHLASQTGYWSSASPSTDGVGARPSTQHDLTTSMLPP